MKNTDWTKDTTPMPFDLKPLDAKLAELHRIRDGFAKRWTDRNGNLTPPIKAVYKLSCELDNWDGIMSGLLAGIADRQISKFLSQPDPDEDELPLDLADLDLEVEV